MGLVDVAGTSYHLSPPLENHWKGVNLKIMKKRNSDRVYIVDGMERSGKSWFAIQQAGALDKNMFKDPETFVSRICFTPKDFFDAVRNVENGVIIFDEAFRGFSSRSSISRTNKMLVQALMEMGQNNNIVFIVLPRIWLLDLYPAMLRSHGLFNIYVDRKSGRRVWRGYNYRDKNFLYQQGAKRSWKYTKTSFQGNFYNKFPGGEEFEKAYLAKKKKALQEMDNIEKQKEETKKQESRFMKQRDVLLALLHIKYKEKYVNLEKLFKTVDCPLTKMTLGVVAKPYREIVANYG